MSRKPTTGTPRPTAGGDDVEKPIHVGTVNDRPVRFFRSPKLGPDMPWIAQEDLLAALGMSRRARKIVDQICGKSKFTAEQATIETPGGKVAISSHVAAKGFIGAMIEGGELRADVMDQYALAGVPALRALTDEMTWTERFAWARTALHRTD